MEENQTVEEVRELPGSIPPRRPLSLRVGQATAAALGGVDRVRAATLLPNQG